MGDGVQNSVSSLRESLHVRHDRKSCPGHGRQQRNRPGHGTGLCQELESLETEIETGGGEASSIQTDVSSAEDVEKMVDHTVKTFGRLDYAVNNAGVEGELQGIAEFSEQNWDRVLDTNLRGTFL